MTLQIQIKKYRGQPFDQPEHEYNDRARRGHPYLFLTNGGVVGFDVNYGDMRPIYEHYKEVLTWTFDQSATGKQLNNFLNDKKVVELLERIHEGHEVDWDGCNFVGSLDKNAKAAASELERIIETSLGECW